MPSPAGPRVSSVAHLERGQMSQRGAAEEAVPVIVVGASAGGVNALGDFVSGLPTDVPAAVLVVLHLAPSGTSVLPSILGRRTAMASRFAEDGGQLVPGTI